jgi:hypothetical protein
MRRWQRNSVDGIITSVPSAAQARAPWPWDKRKGLQGFCPSEHDDHGWGGREEEPGKTTLRD